MVRNHIATGVIAVLIGYLLGSIPFAYIFTHLTAGKDVRKVSGGNVGTRNVFLNIGKAAGVATLFFDVSKGFASVAIASHLMNSPILSDASLAVYFVLAAGVAAVAGHIWPLYLKFKGGNGLATTLGVLIFVMPWEMVIALCITLLLWAITRNVILSFNLSLFSLSVSGWLLTGSWVYIIYPLIIITLMLLHLEPDIIAEIRRANSSREFFDDLLRRRKK